MSGAVFVDRTARVALASTPCDGKSTLIGFPTQARGQAAPRAAAPAVPAAEGASGRAAHPPKVMLDLVALGDVAASIEYGQRRSTPAPAPPRSERTGPLRGATLGKATLQVAAPWLVRPLARPAAAARPREQVWPALAAVAVAAVASIVALMAW